MANRKVQSLNSAAVNRVVVHHGAAAQAIRLLRFWAEDASDDPKIIEACKQSREAASDLSASLTRAALNRTRRAKERQ